MMMEENGSKKVLLSVLGVAILVVAVVGISFAAFSFTKESNENSISTGSITMSYTEAENGIKISEAFPLEDSVGMTLKDDHESLKAGDKAYFEFTVATGASGVVNIPYEINVTVPTVNPDAELKNDQVKIYLTTVNGDAETAVSEFTQAKLVNSLEASTVRSGALVLHEATDTYATAGSASKTTTYRLRIWVDKSVDAVANANKSYKVLVNVDSTVNSIA